MQEQSEPQCTLRGVLNDRRIGPRQGSRTEIRRSWGVWAQLVRGGRYTGWVAWSQDGQLVGYACSPGYVKQEQVGS